MRKVIWIPALALALLLAGCGVSPDAAEPPTTDTAADTGAAETAPDHQESATSDGESYEPAPDFTVYDGDGTAVKLSDFRGKPVVLNFWSSKCGPCRSEMPDFQAVYEELGDRVQFLMVNVTDGSWDTVDTASAFLADSGYTFPVFFDTGVEAAAVYGVSALPTTCFINSAGEWVAYGRGMLDKDTLMEGIGMILPE